MRVLLIFLLGCILLSCHRPEYFEGEIKYRLTFSPDTAKIDTLDLKKYYGEQWSFYFKEGNIRWDMAGTYWLRIIFNSQENKLYYLPKEFNEVAWKNAEKATDQVITIQIMPNQESILGNKCHLLTIESKLLLNNYNRKRYYYYSPTLKVNPEWFAKCNDSNYKEIFGRIKAIPLKIVDQYEAFTITYEAIEIKNKKLSNEIFGIAPELTKVEL